MVDFINEVMNPLAMSFGYLVLISGGLGLTAFLVTWPIDYVWRRYGDVRALISVIIEANRQGRKLYKKGGSDE